MRYSKTVLLSTLSAFALLTASTASQAFAPSVTDMGLLRPHGDWHVGAINTHSANYCAMINQFDKEISLAFARNPSGYGSLAIDFPGEILETGTVYSVTLQVDDMEARQFNVRASSPHSVIIQIGQDEDFYGSLATNGTLRIALPAVDMRFELNKFSSSYISLVSCADKLQQPEQGPRTAAMPVTPVEKTALAGTPLTSPAVPSQPVTAMSQKTHDGLQMQKDAVQRSLLGNGVNTAATNTAPIPLAQQKIAAATTPAAGKSDIVWSADKNKEQDSAARDQKSVVSRLIADNKVVTEENAELKSKLEQSKTEQAELSNKINLLKTEKDDLQAKIDMQDKQSKLMEASLNAKERDLASVRTLSIEDSKTLAEVQSELTNLKHDHTMEIADLQTRLAEKSIQYDTLQKQFSDVGAVRRSTEEQATQAQAELDLSRQRLTQAQDQLAASEQQRTELIARIDSQSQQSKALIDVQAELAALKRDRSSTVADLQNRLSEKESQYSSLQKKFLEIGEAHRATEEQATQAQTEIDLLHQRLTQAQSQLAAAEKQKNELAARMDAEGLQNKSLADAQSELATLKHEHSIALADLQTKLAEKEAQNDFLQKKFLDIGETHKTTEAQATQAQAEIDLLRQRLVQAQSQLASVEQQKAELATRVDTEGQQSKSLTDVQSELAALKHDNILAVADLQTKLSEKTAQYDALKKQLTDVGDARKSTAVQVAQAQAELDLSRQRLAQAQAQLTASEQQKKELAARIDAQGQQNKTLADVQADLAKLKHDNALAMTDLQTKLTEKTVQYEALKKQFTDISEVRKSKEEQVAQSQSQLDQSQLRISQMQAQLSAAERQKNELSARIEALSQQSKIPLEKMQEQLDKTHEQISMLESQMMTVAVQRDDLKTQLDAQNSKNKALQSILEAKEKELAAVPEVTKPVASISPVETAKPKTVSPPIAKQQLIDPAETTASAVKVPSLLPPPLPATLPAAVKVPSPLPLPTAVSTTGKDAQNLSSSEKGGLPAITTPRQPIGLDSVSSAPLIKTSVTGAKGPSSPMDENWETIVVQ